MKTEIQNDSVHRAMEFQLNDIITRYARDYELSYEDAERHMFELRRFLAMCAINDGPAYGMRGQIDEAWHTFIMFTREYADFCQAVGGRFIHHQPNTDSEGRSNTPGSYQRFLDDYERVFCEPAPADLWPRPFTRSGVDANCGGCSACGSDDSPMNQVSEATNCDGCNSCDGKS